MTTTTTKTAKSPKFANLSIQQRGQLEREFIDRHKHAAEASKAIRLDRVYAGQALLELKDGTAHGDWQPYLSELCGRAGIAERTARDYMNDAATASKIPQAVLDEAAHQGFNIKARRVRQALVNWLLEHPTDEREPKRVVAAALVTFVPPSTAEQKAAIKAENARFAEFKNFREAHPDPNDAGYAKYKEFAWNFPDPEHDAYAARQQAQQAKWSRDEGTRKQQEAFALQIIDAGYKALAQKHHPDHGGKTEDFQLLKEAKDLLKASLRETTVGTFGFRR